MKTLILCRHAKSDWPSAVADIDRPLKKRGIENAEYLGKLLANQDFMPDLIVSSPANRALGTARLVANKLGYDRERIQIESAVYHQGMAALLKIVASLPEQVDTAMIFGHNPTMEDTVREILGSEAAFYMPTGAMACLESYGNTWAALNTNTVHLRWFLVPRLQRQGDD